MTGALFCLLLHYFVCYFSNEVLMIDKLMLGPGLLVNSYDIKSKTGNEMAVYC